MHYCSCCNYKTNDKSNMTRHYKTKKHSLNIEKSNNKIITIYSDKEENEIINTFLLLIQVNDSVERNIIVLNN